MKKVFICINALALSLCACAAYGKAVDENTAKTIGSNYLNSIGIQSVRSASDLVTANITTSTINGSIVTNYYIFNFVGANGFVMVSADDRVTPILAFSNESSFDINRICPDAKWWLTGYQKHINYAIESNLPASPATAQQWVNLKTAKANKSSERTTTPFPSSTVHLVQTKWDQEPGYNMYCPTGTPTGCVATCMAEVMQFWNWPTIGTGSHSYKAPAYGVLTADFGNTVYDWATMDANLNSSTTATARLMQHAGIAVNMNYTTTSEGSGAYVADVQSPILISAEYAMKTYFHYKPSLRGYSRSAVSFPYSVAGIATAAWQAMIKAELDAGRPVMYTGQGSDGGHCWVADGYNSTNLFHFNFGWSGSFNGYFSVDNVDPGPGGTGGGAGIFNDDQSIIIGIQPDSFPNTTGNIKLAASLNTTTSSPVSYGGAFSFSTEITNSGTSSFSGSICAQVFDTANVLKGTIQTLTGQTIAAGATSSALTFSTTAMYSLLPEDYYHVRIMYQPTGSSTWTAAANNGNFINYNIVSVANDTDLQLNTDLSVTSTLPVPTGGTISVFSQILNYGSNDFFGTFEGVLVNVTTGTSYVVQTLTGSTLGSFLDDDFTFSGSVGTAPSGVYAFEVKHQYNGTGNFYMTGNRFYQNPILVHIGSSASVNAISALENKVSVFPNPANDIVNINAQGINFSEVRVVDIDGREVRSINTGNQTEYTLQVGDLAPGAYFIQLRSGADIITKKIIIAK